MEWYRVTFSAAEVGQGKAMSLLLDFTQLYVSMVESAGDYPTGVALLQNKGLPNPRHIYFTPACFPAALELAMRYDAVVSQRPHPDEVKRLIGSKDLLDVYYRDSPPPPTPN
jgi:hypothetical protein